MNGSDSLYGRYCHAALRSKYLHIKIENMENAMEDCVFNSPYTIKTDIYHTQLTNQNHNA